MTVLLLLSFMMTTVVQFQVLISTSIAQIVHAALLSFMVTTPKVKEGVWFFFNSDWHTLPYFVTSCETAFAMEFLRRLDMEILIGQLSFKQRAEIFNIVHSPTIADMGR